MLARTLFAAVLMLSAGALRAQSTMSVDGSCNFQLSTTGSSVSINPTTGNVTVTSQTGTNCTTPGGVSLTLPASAPTSSAFNVSWSATGTTGANPCTPTGGGGSTWSAQGALPASGTRSIVAPSTAASNVAFTISCATPSGSVQDTELMSFTGVASLNLVTPTSVTVSQSFTISWTSSGTTGTTPCTPSGGGSTNWSAQGPFGPNGSTSVTAPSSAGSAVFTMTCQTPSGTVVDSESVSFTAGGGGGSCAGVVPPSGIGSGATGQWTSIYGHPFPIPYQAQRTIGISQATTRVIQFVAPSAGQVINGTSVQSTGSLHFFSSNPGIGAGVITTISECPNDFRSSILNTATNRCYRGPAGTPGMSFSLINSGAGFCNLVPGRTYYINMHAGSSSSPDSTGAFCEASVCSFVGGALGAFTELTEQSE